MKEALSDTRAVLLLGLLAAVKGAALVGIAEAIARGIVAVLDGGDLRGSLTLGIAAVLLRAGAAWATRAAAARAAIGAKSRLRLAFAQRLLAGPLPAGRAAAIGGAGLDEIDELYRTVLPAATAAAAVPLVAGARILTADWVSALIVVLTVPLVPVFMVLVGRHAQDQADASANALQRLSHHLAELARGLPVLVGLGRLEQQSAALERIGREHRVATVRTLRSAFLSALVLELIATISVAMVAVFVGVRLIDGTLPLAVGLVALILAPECFAPFREVGSAFHASQDGLAAMRRVREFVAQPVRRRVLVPGGAVRVTGLTVRRTPAITSLSATFPPGTTTALTGVSGTGKSTLLGVLAGTVVPDAGTVGGLDASKVAWMPQHPSFVAPTVRVELTRYGEADPMPLLRRLGVAHLVDAAPARLSPGERRRVAVARALLRVQAGATLLLLDEPTAHLDGRAADAVLDALAEVRGRVTIVLASHDAAALALADRTIALGRQGGARFEAVLPDAADPLPSHDHLVAPGSALRALVRFVRPTAVRFAAAALLGALAAVFAVSLTAVSAWLIVSAAAQPPIMLLLVAIVGVRFFGIGRAALRYAERLLTHDAVLASVGRLRSRLWSGLATGTSRALFTPEWALEHLVVAADRVRDLVPRVLLPIATAVLTVAGALLALALLEPAALPAMLLVSGALLVAPVVTVLADRAATRAVHDGRSTVVRRVAAIAGAAGDLRGNGVAEVELDALARADASAARSAVRGAWALGLGDAIVLLACGAAALLALPVAAAAGTAGPVVAVLALVPLALAEPITAACAAAQQLPALSAALRRVDPLSARPVGLPLPAVLPGRVRRLRLHAVTARWPGAGHDAFAPVSAVAAIGRPLIVEGPSGAGKSTLLSALLGQVPVTGGHVEADGVQLAVAALRDRIAWCPQDAHLFDSSIRGNLLLAAPGAPDGRMREALAMVGLHHDLDRVIGVDGLSGGERQRLAVARAILADRDVVLLDEPTAHLDAHTASSVLRDVRAALADRILIIVTHAADDVAPGDTVVRLQPAAVAVRLAA